jgi:tRNA(Ile)-lysidine synthetase-like protein
MLDVTRVQILSYLRRRSLTFADDPSNGDLRFARARLRQLVLPVLRRENPRHGEALRRLAAEAARAPAGASPVLASAREAGVHVPGRLHASLAQAVRAGGTRTFDVAGGHRLTVRYGHLTVTKQNPRAAERLGRGRSPEIPSIERPIAAAGRYAFDAATALLVREVEAPAPPDGPDLRWAWFDHEEVAWPLTLRGRRPGDRMRPRGGRGSRKLADLLIDAKIPRDERDVRPVVASADGELLYVPGLRPSQVATPNKTTRRLVGIAAVPISGEHHFTGT